MGKKKNCTKTAFLLYIDPSGCKTAWQFPSCEYCASGVLDNAVQKAERGHILTGISNIARFNQKLISPGLSIVDLASSSGIPDYVLLRGVKTNEITNEDITKESATHLFFENDGNAEFEEKLLRGLKNFPLHRSFAYRTENGELISAVKVPSSHKNGQVLTGSCNAREEESVKLASKLTKLSFSAFVTKATLYMARFINRHRRNEQGHPYHPGEAYLFMEHGKRMQDAFTPEEVQQSMEKVGISGSRIANDLMAELERLRDARMNPEAGSMDVPE